MLFGTLHVFFFFSNGKRFHRSRFCSILKSAISGFVSGAETNCTEIPTLMLRHASRYAVTDSGCGSGSR